VREVQKNDLKPLLKKMRGAGTDVSGFFKSSEGPFDGPEKDHGSAGCLTVDSPRTVIDTPVAQMEGSDEEHRAGKATSAIALSLKHI
jgi:hypothetical protein